jgi:hypothetical protein
MSASSRGPKPGGRRLEAAIDHIINDVKCSGETDFKFWTIAGEQLPEFSIDGFLRPGDETSPVILGMLPDDFYQVQLGAVGRQIEEHHLMLEKPPANQQRGVEHARGLRRPDDIGPLQAHR